MFLIKWLYKTWFNKNTKIGVSYNVFDGYELLPFSIKAIREHVDYINIIYQSISYQGNSCDDELLLMLNTLLEQGLIDEIKCVNPIKNIPSTKFEIKKRRVGLRLAQARGCTHFMANDCDEFYETDSFNKAKDFIIKNNIKSSVAYLVDYVKEPIYQINNPNNYYVPFIFKLRLFSNMKKPANFPKQVDGSRCLNSKQNFHEFKQDELLCHHMRLVRKNLLSKYANRSNKKDLKYDIDDAVNNIQNYNYPNKFIDIEVQNKSFEIKKVDNIFNITF